MALVFIDVTLVFTDVTSSMNTNKPFNAKGLWIGIHRWRWYSPIDIGMQGGCGGMNEYQCSGSASPVFLTQWLFDGSKAEYLRPDLGRQFVARMPTSDF
jgi:hypothetical protein